MADPEWWDPEEPPFVHLEEAIAWISRNSDQWMKITESLKSLEGAIVHGTLPVYGSIDTSPVQLIQPWAWTEYQIHTVKGDSKWSIAGYAVRSFKSYRASALKDLSQPAYRAIQGPDGPEPGYYRTADHLIFFEKDLRKAFPLNGETTNGLRSATGKYARILKEIEGGKYLYAHEPLEFDDIVKLIIDYLRQKGPLRTQDDAIRTGLRRHYRK